MEIFFFLKPIVDLVYQYQILDYFLTALVIIFLIKNNSFRICNIDYIVICLMVMFFLSFLRDTSGAAILMKVESAFGLYFLGRNYWFYWGKFSTCLQYGFLLVFVVSALTLVTGTGFQYWGNVRTFTSLYYFKTDAAYAFSQCLIFFSIGFSRCRCNKLIMLLCIIMTVLTNARAHYFITVLLALCYYGYLRENRAGAWRLAVNSKSLLIALSVIVVLLIGLNLLTPYFSNRFLLFSFDKVSDIMNGANTQGRSDIWALIYDKFNSKDLFTKLFGIDLVSATAKVNGMKWSAHNMYIKILYSIGYVGAMMYVIFLFLVGHYLNRLRNRRLFYMTLTLFITFLISGLSCVSIEDVQRTWLPMFFIGVTVSKVQTYMQ